MTILPYFDYCILYYLSYIHVFTSWYALNHGHRAIGLLPIGIFAGSIAHWRYPTHGWTQKIHQYSSFAIVSYTSLRALNAQYTREYLIGSSVSYLFYLGRNQFSKKQYYMFFHIGLQFCVCVSQLYLYSGWIKDHTQIEGYNHMDLYKERIREQKGIWRSVY